MPVLLAGKKSEALHQVQKTYRCFRGFYRYCKLNNYYDDITYEVRGMKIQPTFKRQALSIEDSKRLLQKSKTKS